MKVLLSIFVVGQFPYSDDPQASENWDTPPRIPQFQLGHLKRLIKQRVVKHLVMFMCITTLSLGLLP